MTGLPHSSNRITINTEALRHNYRTLVATLPEGVPLLAMVKGDAYGHGMIESARAFASAGCTIFGVAELSEGVQLRKAGVEGEIFIMVGFLPEYAEEFFIHKLTPVVFSKESIEILSKTAVQRREEITIHLKLDCGMSRLGVMPEEIEKTADLISSLPGVSLGGVLSHFPQADDTSSESTDNAFSIFSTATEQLEKRFSTIRHIANSGAVLNFPQTLCDMGRAGIALYGYAPDGKEESRLVGDTELRPAMKFSTRIAMVKEVPEGVGISYGSTYVTKRPTRLAVMPVGYEDGYPRCLSNSGEVIIQGHKVPILGRICMNLCMADITEIEGVQAGDEAVFLGEQGGESITADDIAAKANTISYEILCMLGNNNERIHV